MDINLFDSLLDAPLNHVCVYCRRWVTVAGIRSTGVSACFGIARQVWRALAGELAAVPRSLSSRPRSPGPVAWWLTPDGSAVVLDGAAYRVTHPLSRLGLTRQHASKLWGRTISPETVRTVEMKLKQNWNCFETFKKDMMMMMIMGICGRVGHTFYLVTSPRDN